MEAVRSVPIGPANARPWARRCGDVPGLRRPPEILYYVRFARALPLAPLLMTPLYIKVTE